MSKRKRRQRKIAVWLDRTLGTLFSKGTDKNDPRYREMNRRMKIQSRDLAVVVVVLIIVTIIGLIWAFAFIS